MTEFRINRARTISQSPRLNFELSQSEHAKYDSRHFWAGKPGNVARSAASRDSLCLHTLKRRLSAARAEKK